MPSRPDLSLTINRGADLPLAPEPTEEPGGSVDVRIVDPAGEPVAACVDMFSEFEDYIAWLQQQDFGKAETFWRRLLDGYNGAAPISIDSARRMQPGGA